MTAAAQICSQCGWSFDEDALQRNACKKCGSAILVTSVAYLEKFDRPAIQKYTAQYSQMLKVDPSDRDALLALGICYLKLSLFDLADRFLRQLIDTHPEDPAGYYYRAICLLRGKRPRMSSLPSVREAERLIDAASALDPSNGRYEILLAAVRYDYYVTNGLRVPSLGPDDLIAIASTKYVDKLEVRQSFRLISGFEVPKAIASYEEF